MNMIVLYTCGPFLDRSSPVVHVAHMPPQTEKEEVRYSRAATVKPRLSELGLSELSIIRTFCLVPACSDNRGCTIVVWYVY